ncbi:hypothetical protein M501DRAFT_988227 [Patellaria atrata CBS 101060]|uniref:Centrosomin N-terminal motif 1 domain-containing protein n=1 Tax=Patellaria atrata CBS 101060 TaxID=1346257 RepID=A0A9P4SGL6_9PEZI|nr:hypothetical protein M501DRAFT_988227 [Patellaria atrata CBS 101060]
MSKSRQASLEPGTTKDGNEKNTTDDSLLQPGTKPKEETEDWKSSSTGSRGATQSFSAGRRSSLAGSSTPSSLRRMGNRDIDQQMDKMSKEIFDLKLRITLQEEDHAKMAKKWEDAEDRAEIAEERAERLEDRNQVLETENEQLKKKLEEIKESELFFQQENTEVLGAQEQMAAELKDSEDALSEAANVIQALQDKVEQLERSLESSKKKDLPQVYQAPSFSHDSDYFSAASTSTSPHPLKQPRTPRPLSRRQHSLKVGTPHTSNRGSGVESKTSSSSLGTSQDNESVSSFTWDNASNASPAKRSSIAPTQPYNPTPITGTRNPTPSTPSATTRRNSAYGISASQTLPRVQPPPIHRPSSTVPEPKLATPLPLRSNIPRPDSTIRTTSIPTHTRPASLQQPPTPTLATPKATATAPAPISHALDALNRSHPTASLLPGLRDLLPPDARLGNAPLNLQHRSSAPTVTTFDDDVFSTASGEEVPRPPPSEVESEVSVEWGGGLGRWVPRRRRESLRNWMFDGRG